MPCYHPVEAWKKRPGPDGKGGIVFCASAGVGLPIKIPCSGCIGCRLDKAHQWAVRISHEAKLWDKNVFLTLTYSDAHLPANRSLDKTDLQKFWKRMRKHFGRLRYFAVGEYGEKLLRPHWHAIVFNLWFSDSVPRGKRGEHQIWTSAKLDEIWGKGTCEIGSVSPDSAGYVARYSLKKITGDRAKKHYERVDPDTGEIWQVEPEMAFMSRRPGIGREWYERYKSDFFPDDFVIFKGRKSKVPSYYARQLPEDQLTAIKAQRKLSARSRARDNTPRRLLVREEVKLAQIKQLQRNLK